MEARKLRRADRVLRPGKRSPGRPSGWRREHRQRFWEEIARGLSSGDAGVAAGVSPTVGTRWFRQSGGMASITLAPVSGRYLSFSEREEIALLHARDCGVREIARRLGRSPSTISRELRRNAATPSGNLEYRASTAQWHSDQRARRPKVAKLAANDALPRLRPGSARSHDRDSRRDNRGRPGCSLDRTAPRTPTGSTLGEVVESRADREPLACRFPS